MFKFLRIIFTILSALCVTPAIFMGIYVDFTWTFIFAGGALIFFMLAAHFKNLQLQREEPDLPQQGDFFNPLPKEENSDEESKDE